MQITRRGSQPSAPRSAESFTSSVRIDPLFQTKEPARGFGASVTFEPGAAPTPAMTHIAIVEVLDGKSAGWREKVSDRQYEA